MSSTSGFPPAIPANTPGSAGTWAANIIFPTFATLAVIGRFYGRAVKKTPRGWDDWLIVVSLAALLVQVVLCGFSVTYGGIGHSLEDPEVTPANIAFFYRMLTGVQFTFAFTLGFCKLSICALMARVFVTPGFKRAVYFVAAYCCAWMLMVIGLAVGLCWPFAYNWDRTLPGKCGNSNLAYIFIAVFDMVGDAMLIALPMPWVWRLQASRMTKIGLSFIFALGIMDIVVAILRIIYLQRVSFLPGSNFLGSMPSVYITSMVEPSVAIVVACGPLMRPLIKNFFPKLRLGFTSYKSNPSKTPKFERKFGRPRDQYSNISVDNITYPLKTVESRGTTNPSALNKRREDDEFPAYGRQTDLERGGITVKHDIEISSSRRQDGAI